MKHYVLDSWALVAFFKGEPTAEMVDTLINSATDGKATLQISLINWGEVVTAFERKGGAAMADAIIAEIDTLPIDILPPDRALTRRAAATKAREGISYADAFCAELGREKNAEVVTGDLEFKSLEGEIAIHWLPGR
jgi:ribonuclease VapC